MQRNFCIGLLSSVVLLSSAAHAAPAKLSYSDADFVRVSKFDVHVHDNVSRDALLEVARKDNFELLSINVDYPDFPPLPLQAKAALGHRAQDPARFHFATAFSMNGF